MFIGKSASDAVAIRQLSKHNASHIKIFPKIENQEGVDNIEEIIAISDGLMVARGDLGMETQQKKSHQHKKTSSKFVTTMVNLSSQQRRCFTDRRFPRPTRAEASDVANAILDGTDAIMLSGETAAGDYPIQSVQMMHTIAKTDRKNARLQDALERIKHAANIQ